MEAAAPVDTSDSFRIWPMKKLIYFRWRVQLLLDIKVTTIVYYSFFFKRYDSFASFSVLVITLPPWYRGWIVIQLNVSQLWAALYNRRKRLFFLGWRRHVPPCSALLSLWLAYVDILTRNPLLLRKPSQPNQRRQRVVANQGESRAGHAFPMPLPS